MIFKALEYIRIYLGEQIEITEGGTTTMITVNLDNVGKVTEPNSQDDDRLIISLVNIEEEYTKKNIPAIRKETSSGNVIYQNPPVFLNLYVLFCANNSNYDTALTTLSNVISCFQAKNSFTISNTGLDASELNLSLQDERIFKIDLELFTLTFEQLNHMWGTLGGKQIPSVMYKMRLVELEKETVQGRGQLINEVNLKHTVQ